MDPNTLPGNTSRARSRLLTARGIAVLSIWVGGGALLLALGLAHQEQILEWKQSLDAVPYFAVLIALSIVGVPTVPLYVAAGALFGPLVALAGCALSLLVTQSIGFVIARSILRNPLQALLERCGVSNIIGSEKQAAMRILLIRLAPALPPAAKNHLAALSGGSFLLYLAVSWPVTFAGNSALVLLGDSLVTERPLEALLAVVVLSLLGGLLLVLRRRTFGGGAVPEVLREEPWLKKTKRRFHRSEKRS